MGKTGARTSRHSVCPDARACCPPAHTLLFRLAAHCCCGTHAPTYAHGLKTMRKTSARTFGCGVCLDAHVCCLPAHTLLLHLAHAVKAQVWFWKLSDTKVANVMWSSVIKLGIGNMWWRWKWHGEMAIRPHDLVHEMMSKIMKECT
jgi:hypothetical protein